MIQNIASMTKQPTRRVVCFLSKKQPACFDLNSVVRMSVQNKTSTSNILLSSLSPSPPFEAAKANVDESAKRTNWRRDAKASSTAVFTARHCPASIEGVAPWGVVGILLEETTLGENRTKVLWNGSGWRPRYIRKERLQNGAVTRQDHHVLVWDRSKSDHFLKSSLNSITDWLEEH